MKVLITSCLGQLGDALVNSAPPQGEVIAVGHKVLDITRSEPVPAFIATHRPAVITTAAGYTAVDKAESDHERVHEVNGEAVGLLAQLATKYGARLIHVSTDFVFGAGASRPIPSQAPTNPLSVCGQTKLDGELQAQAHAAAALMVRDWRHVDDHCRGIEAALLIGEPGETYNIGGGQQLLNVAVIDEIIPTVNAAFAEDPALRERFPDAHAARGGSTAELKTFVKDLLGHDHRYATDENKARNEIGNTPSRTFAEGFASTLALYLANENWWRPLVERP